METKFILLGIVIVIAAVGGYMLLSGEDGKPNNGKPPDDVNVTPNVTQPPEPVVKNSAEAITLIKGKYPEVSNISKCENITCSEDINIGEIENGWNLTFWNGSVNCRDGCLFNDYNYFLVYENGSVIKVGEEKWINKTVRIWTDKLEYKKGETVTVYATNTKDQYVVDEIVGIQKLEHNEWKIYLFDDPFTILTDPDIPPMINCGETKIIRRWTQIYYLSEKFPHNISYNDTEKYEFRNRTGNYKFVFGIITTYNPIQISEPIYSNEFKIINSTKNGNN